MAEQLLSKSVSEAGLFCLLIANVDPNFVHIFGRIAELASYDTV